MKIKSCSINILQSAKWALRVISLLIFIAVVLFKLQIYLASRCYFTTVNNLAFSSDGSLLTASLSQNIYLWEVNNQDFNLLKSFPCRNYNNNTISIISSNNSYLVYCGNYYMIGNKIAKKNDIMIYSLTENRYIDSFRHFALGFSPCENYLLLDNGYIYDIGTRAIQKNSLILDNEKLLVLKNPIANNWIVKYSFNKDEKNYILTLLESNTAKKVSSVVIRINDEVINNQHTFITGGNKVYLFDGKDVKEIDFEKDEVRELLDYHDYKHLNYQQANISYNGELFAIAINKFQKSSTTVRKNNYIILIFETTTGSMISSVAFEVYRNISSMSICPVNRTLAVSFGKHTYDGEIYLYHIDTDKIVRLYYDEHNNL